MEKIKTAKIPIILACVMLLQCLALGYWQSHRGNFYIDELYCLGYASSYTAESSFYIPDSEIWKYDAWMESDAITDLLKVDESESLNALPLSERIGLLLHKRQYMGFLNLIMSHLGYDASFYEIARHVLIMNILFFLLAELLLAYIVRKLTGSDWIMLLSILMFGSCGLIMGMCEYIRFYMLAIALMLAVICCHLKLWNEENKIKCLGWEMAGFICAYFGLKHSEFFFVICGFFFSIFIIGLLCKRRWIPALLYVLPLMAGVYKLIYQKTNLFYIVTHLSEYAKQTHGLPLVSYKLTHITSQRVGETLQAIYGVITDKWFGSPVVMAGFIILLVAGLYCIRKADRTNERTGKPEACSKGFMRILFATTVLSITFNCLADLRLDRYQSFNIVLMMILLWCCIGALKDSFGENRFLIAVALITIAGALISQQPGKMPFLYIEQYPQKEVFEEYEDRDNILFKGTDRFAVYDTTAHLGRGTRMLALRPETPLDAVQDLQEEFLAWDVISDESGKMQKELDNLGYGYEMIASTHISDVYLCTKK